MNPALLKVDDLKVWFELPGEGWYKPKPRFLKAVDGVSFALSRGETLGIVGESGCGKSTLARGILGLVTGTSGNITLGGEELIGLPVKAMRLKRQQMQIVFQDPLASLDPRMTVREIIAEPFRVFHPGLSRKNSRYSK